LAFSSSKFSSLIRYSSYPPIHRAVFKRVHLGRQLKFSRLLRGHR
jgi:hypothetical protein